MHVALRDGETQESLLARFTKGVQRSGILKEAREHRFFVPKPEKMRIAARKAARKAARRAARAAARAARSRSPRCPSPPSASESSARGGWVRSTPDRGPPTRRAARSWP